MLGCAMPPRQNGAIAGLRQSYDPLWDVHLNTQIAGWDVASYLEDSRGDL